MILSISIERILAISLNLNRKLKPLDSGMKPSVLTPAMESQPHSDNPHLFHQFLFLLWITVEGLVHHFMHCITQLFGILEIRIQDVL